MNNDQSTNANDERIVSPSFSPPPEGTYVAKEEHASAPSENTIPSEGTIPSAGSSTPVVSVTPLSQTENVHKPLRSELLSHSFSESGRLVSVHKQEQQVKQEIKTTTPVPQEIPQQIIQESPVAQTVPVMQAEVPVSVPVEPVVAVSSLKVFPPKLGNEITPPQSSNPLPKAPTPPVEQQSVPPQVIPQSVPVVTQPVAQPSSQEQAPISAPLPKKSHVGTILAVILIAVGFGGAYWYYGIFMVNQQTATTQTFTPIVAPAEPSTASSTVNATSTSTSTDATASTSPTVPEIEYQVINTIKVPKVTASTTLDVNENQVRDSIEYLLAQKASNQESFDRALEIAKVIQLTLDKTSLTKKEALEFLSRITCLDKARTDAEKKALSYNYISKISTDTTTLQDKLFSVVVTAGDYKEKDLTACSLLK